MKIETLKAIKNLAENGATDGERKAASVRLAEICQKYGISPQELNENELRPLEMVYSQGWNFILAMRLAQMVSDNWNVKHETKKCGTKYDPGRKKLTIYLTSAEIIELKNIYPLYLKELNRQITEFASAFCLNSDIFPPNAKFTGKETEKSEEFCLMVLAAQKMERPRKQLEAENGR